MFNPTTRAHIALFLANLIYGINYTWAKDVMPDYIQPFGFIFLRVIGALLLFWFFHALFMREKVDKKDFPRLMLCGLFGVAINQLLFFKGLNLTTPINAAVIMTSNPILVLLIATVILKEKITRLKISGILLGMAGAVAMISSSLFLYQDSFSLGGTNFTGDLLVFINSSSYGIYLVIVTPLMRKYHPLTVIKWVFLFGFMVVLPFGYQEFTEIKWSAMTNDIWLKTGFVVVGTTFLAYLFNIMALRELSPSIASSYIYLQPLLASLFAVIFGGYSLNAIQIGATVLIFAGVYLVSVRPQSKKS